MVLRPREGGHVLYCLGAEVKVFSSAEWERAQSQGEPLFVLDEQEAEVIETFLRYWLTDEGPGIHRPPGVDVEYDY